MKIDAKAWWDLVKRYLDQHPYERWYEWEDGRVSGAWIAGGITSEEKDELKRKIKQHKKENMKHDPLPYEREISHDNNGNDDLHA